MRFLLDAGQPRDATELLDAAKVAHHNGFDGLLIGATPWLPSPLTAAAWVAGSVAEILIAVVTPIGDRHPLELAEEAVVVDVASGGRLIVIAAPAAGAERDYEEALDLVRVATTAAPFRFDGRRWRAPANLAQNVHNVEALTRLMPTPARARLEIWSTGVRSEVATSRGIGHLVDAAASPADVDGWATRAAANPATVGAPRAAPLEWSTAEVAVAQLRDGRARFGQDWVSCRAPLSAAPTIARLVRPRVQMDRLPDGLERHWRETDAL